MIFQHFGFFVYIGKVEAYLSCKLQRADLKFDVATFPLNHAPTRDYIAESNVEWIREHWYSRDLYAAYALPFPLSAFSYPFMLTIANAQRARFTFHLIY